jgi:hypothetical protein
LVSSTLNIQPPLQPSITRYFFLSLITSSFFTSTVGYNVIATYGSVKEKLEKTADSTWTSALSKTSIRAWNSTSSNSTNFSTLLHPSTSPTSASAICCSSTVCSNHRSSTNFFQLHLVNLCKVTHRPNRLHRFLHLRCLVSLAPKRSIRSLCGWLITKRSISSTTKHFKLTPLLFV